MSDKKADKPLSFSRDISRRGFLRAGAIALAGLTLADWLKLSAFAQQTQPASQPATTGPAKARSVIMLWMGGGPPHTDTFDPKPNTGDDYAGPYRKAIDTSVPGIQIGQMLPLLAKQADKYSIIRGMTHPSNAHETATYIMQTGTLPGDLVYPSIGAVIAYKLQEQGAYKGDLPPYISIANSLGRFSEAGFLGTGSQPFSTGGDPNAKEFRVNGLAPAAGLSAQRLADRRELLKSMDTSSPRMASDEQLRELESYQQKAYGLMLGEAKKAFDLSQEKDEVRERYGRTMFGQSCLLARRLAENGVPFITVNWGGWDTHKQHFEAMDKMLPNLDKGFSALLEDLAQRGLLDSTIVLWTGEFGRTPKIAKDPPWVGGRHHHAAAFSAVVAGGGFKGGKVVGATDNLGEKVKERPVYPWDLSASIYKLMGIDPAGRLPHPQGRVVYVTPPVTGAMKKGGLLTEIM